MPGQEAIVLPIIIDPKAGVAGLRAIGDEALRTDAKMKSLATGGGLGKFNDGLKGLARNFLQLNPLISVATGFLASYVVGLIGAGDGYEELSEKQQLYNKRIQESITSTSQEITKINVLVEKLKGETLTREQRNTAIKELQKIAPAYFSTLNIENFTIDLLTKAYDKYTSSIRRSIEAKVIEKELIDLTEKRLKLERELGVGQNQVNTVIRNGRVEVASINSIYMEKDKLVSKTKELNDTRKQETDLIKKLASLTDLKPTEIKTKEIKIKTPKVKIEAKDYSLEQFLFRRAVKIEAEPGQIPENIKNLTDLFKPVGETDTFKRYQEGIRQVRAELEALRATQLRIADDVSGVLTPAFDSFIDAIISGEPPLKAFFQSIGNSIVNLTKKIVEAIIQAAILSAISGGAAGGGFSFKTAFKKIIGFASGGLVTGPVSALVGEGPGTNRSNPEVVAPLDKLKYFFNSMMTDNRGFGVGNMGTANATVNVPQRVMLYADGRTLKGIMTLETSSQRRTG